MSMVSLPNKLKSKPLIPSKSAQFLREKMKQVIGVLFFCLGGSLITILITYDPTDPSFRSATSTSAKNALGSFGSYIADPLHLAIGMASYSLVFLCFVWGWRFTFKISAHNFFQRIVFSPLTLAFLSMLLAAHPTPNDWDFAYGIGGVFGDNAFSLILGIAILEINNWLKITTIFLAVSTIALACYTIGLTFDEFKKIIRFSFASIWSTFYYLTSQNHNKDKISDLHRNETDAHKIFDSESTEERIKTRINEVIVTRNIETENNKSMDAPNDFNIPTL